MAKPLITDELWGVMRTAITRALDSGLTYRQVQMMSKHKDPKTVMRYDHGRENMEHNAVNFPNRTCKPGEPSYT